MGACGDDGATNTSWDVVAMSQPSALLSVWAGSPTNVWVVGGEPTMGGAPVVKHYDGTAWTTFDTGQTNLDLWWVFGFSDGKVYMGGSHGTILSTTDGSSFTKMTTPPDNVTVFGIWGASSSDAWAVGGLGGAGGFLWHFDGSAWTPNASIPQDLVTQGTCWKVAGRSASDVWIAGTNGTTLHWTGSALERSDVPDAQNQQLSLFSVAVTSDRVFTVGGGDVGVLYENSGSSWSAPIPSLGVRLSGLAATLDGDAYAVGGAGTILHRGSDGTWATDKSNTTTSLHAAFIDSSGDAWAVGGNFDSQQTTNGVVLHKGAALKGTF